MNEFMEIDDFSIQKASALPPCIAPEAVGRFPEQFSGRPFAAEASLPRSGLEGRELYSKEQWDAQKSVIKQLYNLDNKPYSRVIEILRIEHNFFPTRRQFYRKISEWGFGKNIKDKEMRAFLKLLNDDKIHGEKLDVELRGRKVDPVRILRWQKRHGKVASVTRSFLSNSCVISSTQEASSAIVKEEPLQENDEDQGLTQAQSNIELPQAIDESHGRSFDHWSAVDIPGSPLLTRLFKALKIECEGFIPSLDLTSSIPAAALISTAEADLSEENCVGAWVDFSLGAASNDLVHYSQEIFYGPDESFSNPASSSAPLSFSEWSFREWDFVRGYPLKVDVSHLYGISPFPISTSSGRYNSEASRNRFLQAKSLELRENRIKLRLRKLKRTLGAEDPETLIALRSLAATYQAQRRLRQAERLFRHVAVSVGKIFGLKHRNTLEAYINVVHALAGQGEMMQAKKIHHFIHPYIIKLLDRDDAIVLESARLRALWLCIEDFYDEAEEMIRQTIQIRLHTFGPKERGTRIDLGILAMILWLRGKETESERLYRINIQINNELEDGIPNSLLISFDGLISLLGIQKRYDECRDLVTALIKYWGGSAAEDTPDILDRLVDIAWCARAQGQLSDSEHQLRIILERQTKCAEVTQTDRLRTMKQLSGVLADMGRHDEATHFLETIYKEYKRLFGQNDGDTLECCRMLAENYANLGRSNDAVAILQQNTDHARKSGNNASYEFSSAIEHLAELFQKEGRNREAVLLYKEFYDIHVRVRHESPTGIRAIYAVRCLCQYYEKLEFYEDASAILQRQFEDAMNFGEKRNQTLLENMVDLARFLRKAGQYMKAVASYEECLNGFPDVQLSNEDSESIYYGLMVCYEKLGRLDEMNDFCLRYRKAHDVAKEAKLQA